VVRPECRMSGTNNAIRLWRLDPPRVVGELSNAPVCLSFSPDGKHLATFCRDGNVSVWNVENSQVVRHYPEFKPYGIVGGNVCFSPDGNHLAIGDGSGLIRIVDWGDNRLVVDIRAHEQAITSLAYSPDNRLLASGSVLWREGIRLWNPRTGELAGTLVGHQASIMDLRFTTDGRRLVSAGADQTIRIWDVATRQMLRRLRGHQAGIGSLVLSPDDTIILSGAGDGALARWALSTNLPPSQRLELPGSGLFSGFLQDGKSVPIIRHDGAVAIYDVASGRETSLIGALGTNHLPGLAVAPHSGLLACGPPDGSVRIWSLSANRMVTNIAVSPRQAGAYSVLRFSQAEDLLFCVAYGSKVVVWETRTWAERAKFDASPVVWRGELSPDAQTLVLGHQQGEVSWWDWAKGVKLAEARGHRDGVLGLAFAPDGRSLVSASAHGTVALWDARTRRLIAQWKAVNGALISVAFTPDGKGLVAGVDDVRGGAVSFWDLKSQRELLTLSAPDLGSGIVQFSPDGTRLLCAGYSDRSYSGHSYVWTVPSLAELDAEHARQNAAR
jgi:WD40 repeat protein